MLREIKTIFAAGLLVFMDSICAYSASFVRPTVSGCNMVVDEGIWSSGALSERVYAVNSTPDLYIPSCSDSLTLLNTVKEIAPLVAYEYINLTTRSSGTYNAWYAQFSTTGYTNISQWLATVSNPPHWTESTVLTYRSLPSNYWDYSPARLVEATITGYTNGSTQSGFDTVDYGWDGLHQVLLAMEDLYFNVGHVKQGVAGSDYEGYEECRDTLPSCGVPTVGVTNSPTAVLSGAITIGNSHYFSGAYEPNTNRIVAIGGNIIGSSQFKYGVRDNQNVITQVISRTDGVFQWYDFIGLHVVAETLTNVIPATCGNGNWDEQYGSFETNSIVTGYGLVASAEGHEIDDYGFYGTSPNAVYVASSAWVSPDPITITCPPGWFDRGQTCESDGTLAFACEVQYTGGNIHIAYSTSGNTRSGLAVGIARPQFQYQ